MDRDQSWVEQELRREKLSESDLRLVQGVASTLQDLAATRKAHTEADALMSQRRSETTRFWAALIVPFIGSMALVATLAFQIRQHNDALREQHRAAEELQWREAVKTFSEEDPRKSLVGAVLLESFMHSGLFQPQARRLAVIELERVIGPEAFRVLLEPVAMTTTSTSLGDLVEIGRVQRRGYEKARDVEAMGRDVRRRETDMAAFLTQITELSGRLAALLAQYPAAAETLDLRNAALWQADLRNINLRAAQLEGISIYSCNVEGANLAEVIAFDESYWGATAWWRAARISPSLLAYLRREYPYHRDSLYRDVKGPEAYERALTRLRGAG